jgi:hypothetical protein
VLDAGDELALGEALYGQAHSAPERRLTQSTLSTQNDNSADSAGSALNGVVTSHSRRRVFRGSPSP